MVHGFRLRTFHEIGLVSVSNEEAFQFLMADTRKYSRVGNLVSIQVQYRQHRAIGYRVEKFVGMPGRSQGTGFGLSIPHRACDDEVGIIKGGSIRMGDRVAELPSFIDGAGGFGGDMAGDTTWK